MSHERKRRPNRIRLTLFCFTFFALGTLALLLGVVGDLHADPMADIALLASAPILLFLSLLTLVDWVHSNEREGLWESVMAATASWISKTPDRCGGDACIRESRIPVWIVVGYRRRGLKDEEILQAYPSLNAADLEAAWEYAAAHPEEIDRALRENEEGDEGFVE